MLRKLQYGFFLSQYNWSLEKRILKPDSSFNYVLPSNNLTKVPMHNTPVPQGVALSNILIN